MHKSLGLQNIWLPLKKSSCIARNKVFFIAFHQASEIFMVNTISKVEKLKSSTHQEYRKAFISRDEKITWLFDEVYNISFDTKI